VIKFLREHGWVNYLLIWAVWWAGWFAPRLAGDWYDNRIVYFDGLIVFSVFHICQSLIPLFLIYIIFRLTFEKWRAILEIVLVMQIFHNLGDVYFDSDWLQYNARQTFLNHIEQFLIGIGAIPLIYRTARMVWSKRADKSGRNRHNPHARVLSSQSGIAGHD